MHQQTIGSRAQVWHGTAKHTKGYLTKKHLMKNKHGRIVSRKRHTIAKREKRLVKAGYLTKKGHFGFIKKGTKHHGRKNGHKGGMSALSPSHYDGQGVGTSGVAIQTLAGNASS
jgi:DVNP family